MEDAGEEDRLLVEELGVCGEDFGAGGRGELREGREAHFAEGGGVKVDAQAVGEDYGVKVGSGVVVCGLRDGVFWDTGRYGGAGCHDCV